MKPATNDTPPAELWRSIIAMPRESRVVDFPRLVEVPDPSGATTMLPNGKVVAVIVRRPVGQVRLRALTQSEITEAAATARRKTIAKIREDRAAGTPMRADEEIFDNLNACEMLFRSCVDADDPEQKKRVFPTPQAISDHLSSDEIGQLAMSYMLMMSEISPTLDSVGSVEDMDALLDRLRQGGELTPLAGYTHVALSQLLLFSALRQSNSLTQSSSPSSPQDSSTNTDETDDSISLSPSESG